MASAVGEPMIQVPLNVPEPLALDGKGFCDAGGDAPGDVAAWSGEATGDPPPPQATKVAHKVMSVTLIRQFKI
jgi:hypothetical protein